MSQLPVTLAAASGLQRGIGIAAVVLTVAGLAVSIALSRRATRIRPGFDAARVVVSVGAVLVMAAVTGVSTPRGLILVALGTGAGLGFAQGYNLEVEVRDERLFARRGVVGIVLWGVGVIIMQGAGVAAWTGAVRLGQTISYLAIGLTVGLLFGRNDKMQRARRGLVASSALGLMIVLFAGVIPAPRATAQELDDWFQGVRAVRAGSAT